MLEKIFMSSRSAGSPGERGGGYLYSFRIEVLRLPFRAWNLSKRYFLSQSIVQLLFWVKEILNYFCRS